MISYSKTIINSRWDSMPENLREVLSSPAYGGTVFEVADDHHLGEEKTKILLRLVSFVIYGLVHVDELNKKIAKEADIDIKAANEISDELNKKIFSQFKSEISGMYSPIPVNHSEEDVEKEVEKGKSINIKGTAGEISIGDSSESKKVKISKNKPEETTETSKPKTDDKPFILSQDNEKEEEDKKTQRKNVEKRKKSFSFATDGFFNSKKKEKETPKANIQTPGEKDDGGGFFGFGSKNKKDKQEKIVHYSDNRTPLSDDKSDSFINLSNLKPTDSKKSSTENKTNQNLNNKEKLNKINKDKKTTKENFLKNKKQSEQNIGKNTETQNNIKEEESKNVSSKNLEDNDKKQPKKNSDKNNNNSFLGNINITKSDKKLDKNKNKKNSDGPELDGNTVNLKNK